MILLLAIVLLLVGWGTIVVNVVSERTALIEQEKIKLEQLSQVVAGHTEHFLSSIKLFMALIDRWILLHPGTDPRFSEEFNAYVDDFRHVIGNKIDIRLVMQDGGLFYLPSNDRQALATVADREYVLAQDNPATRGFFIARSVKSRVTKVWGIPVSYPIGSNQTGVKLVFAALELPVLDALYSGSIPAHDGRIVLARKDGIILTTVPFDEAQVDTTLAMPSTVEQAALHNGRLEVVRSLNAYPVQVHVSTSLESLLGPWWGSMFVQILVMVLLGLVITMLSGRMQVLLKTEGQYRTELEKLARIDSLTGLMNRGFFLERGADELQRAGRYLRPLCLAILDLDHFKRINDSCGHHEGDRALRLFSGKIGVGIRVIDLAGRIGGEEFAIIMPETGMCSALEIMERLRLSIQEIQTKLGALTVSIGVASWKGSDESLEELMARADAMLYSAKEQGRNRIFCDDAESKGCMA